LFLEVAGLETELVLGRYPAILQKKRRNYGTSGSRHGKDGRKSKVNEERN
jgi:hypothetical protein